MKKNNILKKYITIFFAVLVVIVVISSIVFMRFESNLLFTLNNQKDIATLNDLQQREKSEINMSVQNIEFLSTLIANNVAVHLYNIDEENMKKSISLFFDVNTIKGVHIYDNISKSTALYAQQDGSKIITTKKISQSSNNQIIKKDIRYNNETIGYVEIYYDLSVINQNIQAIKDKKLKENNEFKKFIDGEFWQSVMIKISVVSFALIIVVLSIIYIFNIIIKNVSLAVTSINEISDDIYNTSSKLSNISTALHNNSLSQSDKISHVSSKISDVSTQISKNSNDAKEADKLSTQANDSANSGYDSVKKLSLAMSDIKDSSHKILNIIETIDHIAFQTNLLALNAAVEAARAGEHGLGFAVVAEEVRVLASRSSSAAKEISEIITNSVDKVNYGNNISNSVVNIFETILSKVNTTTKLVSSISSSTVAQINVIDTIISSMDDINDITHKINSDFETANESANLLYESVQKLQNTIVNFQEKE